jgi:hypothetical protein
VKVREIFGWERCAENRKLKGVQLMDKLACHIETLKLKL